MDQFKSLEKMDESRIRVYVHYLAPWDEDATSLAVTSLDYPYLPRAFKHVVGVRFHLQTANGLKHEKRVTCSLDGGNIPGVTSSDPGFLHNRTDMARIETYVDQSRKSDLKRDASSDKVNFVRCLFDVVIEEDSFNFSYVHGQTEDSLSFSDIIKILVKPGHHSIVDLKDTPDATDSPVLNVLLFLVLMLGILILILILSGSIMVVFKKTFIEREEKGLADIS